MDNKRRQTLYLRILETIKSQSGVSMIEFAFVAPIVILLLVGTFEIGLMVVVQNALDGAAREAGRFAKVGPNMPVEERANSVEEKIYNVLAGYTGGFIDPSLVTISAQSYSGLQNIRSPEPFTDTNNNGEYDIGEYYEDINGNGSWDDDQGMAGYGGHGDTVHYIITYDFQSNLPFISNEKGYIRLTGESPVVNELFNAPIILEE